MIIIIELYSKIYFVRDSCVYYGVYLLLFGCMIWMKTKTEYRGIDFLCMRYMCFSYCRCLFISMYEIVVVEIGDQA